MLWNETVKRRSQERVHPLPAHRGMPVAPRKRAPESMLDFGPSYRLAQDAATRKVLFRWLFIASVASTVAILFMIGAVTWAA